MFNIGDTVVKPGLGICKIKAIRTMQVENRTEQFYVLQSGDVKVMVPFSSAHAGGLRYPLDEKGIADLYTFFQEPIRIAEDEEETPDRYAVDLEKAREDIKQRDLAMISSLIKTFFYKEKIADLPKVEIEHYRNALSILADEIAHFEHSTRQKAINRIKAVLTEGRRARKESHLTH